MLSEYKIMLDELESELIIDSHAHSDDIIVAELIDCNIKAIEMLRNYIDVMNEKFN